MAESIYSIAYSSDLINALQNMPISFPNHSRSIRMRAFECRNEQSLKQILTKASSVETEEKFVKIQLQMNTFCTVVSIHEITVAGSGIPIDILPILMYNMNIPYGGIYAKMIPTDTSATKIITEKE